MQVRRVLSFSIPSEGFPSSILAVLPDFRRAVNELLRFALIQRKTSRGALKREAAKVAQELTLNGAHGCSAASVALSMAKGHRRRLRVGVQSKVPYTHRLFLRADDKTFHFDACTGKVRLSLRRAEWVSFTVKVPAHHREVLDRPEVRIKQLVLTPKRMFLVWAKEAPAPYVPDGLVALDTNESSFDGVHMGLAKFGEKTGYFLRAGFPEVRRIQTCAFLLRQKLGPRKANDRRMARLIFGKIGRREHHRVEQRLHELTNRLLDFAEARRAAIALEELSQPLGRKRFGGKFLRWGGSKAARSMRRRISSWPRRELHRLIRYKAEDRGIPVYFVDPRNTSKTCPRCGVISDRRTRVGAIFDCKACGWRLDRQLNAGLNIARTALAARPELGGLMLDPDALPKDVVTPLYPPTAVGGHGRSGREGREGSPRG